VGWCPEPPPPRKGPKKTTTLASTTDPIIPFLGLTADPNRAPVRLLDFVGWGKLRNTTHRIPSGEPRRGRLGLFVGQVRSHTPPPTGNGSEHVHRNTLTEGSSAAPHDHKGTPGRKPTALGYGAGVWPHPAPPGGSSPASSAPRPSRDFLRGSLGGLKDCWLDYQNRELPLPNQARSIKVDLGAGKGLRHAPSRLRGTAFGCGAFRFTKRPAPVGRTHVHGRRSWRRGSGEGGGGGGGDGEGAAAGAGQPLGVRAREQVNEASIVRNDGGQTA